MRLSFRQGIVRYAQSGGIQNFLQFNGSYINLNAANGDVEITLAHKSSNYSFVENATVPNAWGPLDISQMHWLYWDIDLRTAQRTFGTTQLEPVVSNTPPSETLGQHWFDSNDTMRVWNGVLWQEVIRVFAARVDTSQFFSVGVGVGPLVFAGTQLGISESSLSGQIIFDEVGTPIKRTTGEFFSTEDQFFTAGTRVNVSRLESGIELVTATETIPEYSICAYDSAGDVRLANYNDTGDTMLCVVTEDVLLGANTTVIIQGIVTNSAWAWPTVGAPLWILENGQLVDADPNITNITMYPTPRVPVARVLGTDRIIFMQGLGGVGPVGPPSPAATTPATPTTLGIVTTTTADNQVVSTDDTRMTDARFPLAHTHTGTDVSIMPYGLITSSNSQGALQNLEDDKLSITGGVMSGDLTLSGMPTTDLHATTKQYVDSFVSGLLWVDPLHHINLIANNVTDPSTVVPVISDVYVVPIGAVGVWAAFVGRLVLWDGSSWIDLGLVSDLPIGTRFGVAMETTSTPMGTFAGQTNNIAVLINPAIQAWTFIVPVASNAVYVNNEDSLHKYHQYVYDSVSLSWIEFGGPSAPTDHTHTIKETLVFFVGNAMQSDTIVGFVISPTTITFEVGAPDSLAECETPVGLGDPDVVYSIQKNGVEVGNVTFSALATVGVIAMAATTIDIGDKLQIKTQVAVDVNHRDVSISLVGCIAQTSC